MQNVDFYLSIYLKNSFICKTNIEANDAGLTPHDESFKHLVALLNVINLIIFFFT